MMALTFARWFCLILLALALALVVHVATRPRPMVATVGHRGRMRSRARTHAWFRVLEPYLMIVTSGIVRLRLNALPLRVERWLCHSGDHLGVSAHELLALALIESLVAAVLMIGSAVTLGYSAWLGASFGLGLGTLAPLARVRQRAKQRALHIERGLPEAIDLLALCMSGGLDFTSGLRALLGEGSLRYRALQDELERVTEGLALGQTRREALLHLTERVDVPAVRDLVQAILQAERTGTPLRTVLEIQAQMLRLRRSTLAEEAAARAALLLLLPLCLLLSAMLVLLFGPFVVQGLGV
jgi:tight adherence protein C